ncbi:putative deoxyribonuclease TATDN2 isoform 2-T2 [Mantella aurantiaca]
MADGNNSRKHKWSSPPEMSPSKYLRGVDSKLPRGAHRSRDSDSPSPPRERRVSLIPYESTPKRTLGLQLGSSSTGRAESRDHRRTISLDFQRSDRQERSTPTPRASVSLTEGDHRLEMDDGSKIKSEVLPRSRAGRLHAPSLLFKRAFSDIGVSPRGRRSQDGLAASPPEAGRMSRVRRRESENSEPPVKTDTPEEEMVEERSSWRSESADHPSQLRRTITRLVPKSEPEIRREKSRRSEPSVKAGTTDEEIVEEDPSWRSESADHQDWIRPTITRPGRKKEPEVHREKPRRPEPSAKVGTADEESMMEDPSWRSESADHPSQIRQTITRPAHKKEQEVRREKSRHSEPQAKAAISDQEIMEEDPSWKSESADHQGWISPTITRPAHKKEPEVRREKSRHSEPQARVATSDQEIMEEDPSRKSESADHQGWISPTITRPAHKKETKVRREKSRRSEPSATPKEESMTEDSSWRSESADHSILLRQTMTRTDPKKVPEVHKEKSRHSEPPARAGASDEEIADEKSSWKSDRADDHSWLRQTMTKAVPKKEPEVRKEKSRRSEPSPRTGNPDKAEEESSWRSESSDHSGQLGRTISRVFPKEETGVRQQEPEIHQQEPEVHKRDEETHKEEPEAPPLVFSYDSDKGDDPEKDPSIGSDFSDIEDVGTLARFSQEDSPLTVADAAAGTPSPGYVAYPRHMYSNAWSGCPDLWPASPAFKPSAEQNKWRQDALNKSCASEVSFNAAECSRNTSSDSEGEAGRRRERSRPFDVRWARDERTKSAGRTWEASPAADCSAPRWRREGFIDTHCHLDMLFSRLQHQRSFASLRQQYSSTFPSEFQGCVTDYCDPRTLERLPWRHVLNEDLVWGAFGCHPHFAQYYTPRLQEEMMQAMRHPKAIAYGEMGLDYSHKCSTTVPDQHAVFEKQLKLAVPLGKPLVIHCRDADEDLFRIMKKCVPWDYKIHRHCFTGGYKDIEPFLSEFPNMSVGFTAVLTYSSASCARESVTRIPLDRLIVETDAPFFVPRQVPKSVCKFSHPGLALHTVEEIARLKNLPVRSVMAKVRENTRRLYNI